MTIIEIPGFDLALTADSGQCFRFGAVGPQRWQLVAKGRVLHIEDLGAGRFAFDCEPAELEALWRPYFDLDRDYLQIHSRVPEADTFLSAALAYAGGLRILRQEPFEALICFIISQRKNIPAIKRCVEALCQRFGQPIADNMHAFPSPQALAGASLEALNACGLGYRSGYIQQSSRLVAEGEADLQAMARLPDEALQVALMQLPGAGVKVANCAMLFGFHRVGAFPRDVWIDRVIDRAYGGDFPLAEYEGVAGIIQQYLFCYARGPGLTFLQQDKEKAR